MTEESHNTVAETSAKQPEIFIVTDEAVEPDSDTQQCFYCNEAIGEAHSKDCPLISKTVRVHLDVEYTACLPAHWNEKDIKFHYYAKKWDVLDLVDEILEIRATRGCACEQVTFQHAESCDDTHA